jgi:GT2 family glycosyltransferase
MSNVSVSIVSHGHDDLVTSLLSQLVEYNEHITKVIITHNIPGNINYSNVAFPFEVIHITNREPLGFGENHNRAFENCCTEYYCVMNPDIILKDDPFGELLACSVEKKIAIIAPVIENIQGDIEDSARYFPTPFDLLKKIFRSYDGIFPTDTNKNLIFPEWVGGMFMLIKRAQYEALSGFDESYFLYYEDVDLCLRAWRSGNGVALCKSAVVVHDARRTSHRKLKFLKWHMTSALRFFIKYLGRFPKSESLIE